MKSDCPKCHPNKKLILHSGINSQILIPRWSHISPEEGGHLIVAPKRHLKNRFYLDPSELFEMTYLSLVAGHLLENLCKSDWFNYQENGNWNLTAPKTLHIHLHVYGRKKNAKDQLYGESLRFPLKKEIANWKITSFDDKQIKLLKKIAGMILSEKWAKNYETIIASLAADSK